MRIEYFASGGLDCPLILLYGDDPGDAEILRDAIKRLASGQIAQVSIHELPGFESVENCRLIARVSRSDAGI